VTWVSRNQEIRLRRDCHFEERTIPLIRHTGAQRMRRHALRFRLQKTDKARDVSWFEAEFRTGWNGSVLGEDSIPASRSLPPAPSNADTPIYQERPIVKVGALVTDKK